MADTPNGERTSLRPSPRSSLRPETLSLQLDKPIEDEGKLLDALVAGLASGETTPELFTRLHDAVVAQERVANLSFAYERLARDNRIKLLARPKQSEFYLAAARFFGDVFGDVDAAIGYAERARDLNPDDAQVFDQLETLLASGQQGIRLAKLYRDAAERSKDRAEKLRLLRAAIDLLDAYNGQSDELIAAYRQINELEPGDRATEDALEKLYVAARRPKDLAELLERALARSAGTESTADGLRLRLIGLYRGELRDPAKAAPHVEVLLGREPIGPAALQAAEALVDHRPIASRIAPMLSEAYRRLGRLEDEASTLALELKLARPPRLVEVQRRLAILRQDVLGDPSGALELLEPLVARDPSDDALRGRYLAVNTTFHREVEAAKLLARAIGSAKNQDVRLRVSLEIATLYARQGDPRRARAALEPFVEDAPSDAARLAVAKRIAELHQDGSDPKGLGRALEVVLRTETDLAPRIAAAKRLAELCDGPLDDARLSIAAWRALLDSPRVEDALDRLERLCGAASDDAGLIDVFTRRSERAKDPAEAREFAFRATELRAARAPDRLKAIEAWRKFVEERGPSADALSRIAAALEQQRLFAELTKVLEQLAALLPLNERAATHARLGRVLLTERKEPGPALASFRAALEIDPKEAIARRLVERLVTEGEHRLDAARLLEPICRSEANHAGLLRVLEARADLSSEPEVRFAALDEAFDLSEARVEGAKKSLDLAARALGLLAHGNWENAAQWLERFRRAAARAGDPSRRADLIARAFDGVAVDRPEAALLGREVAEAWVTAGELARAIEVYRRLHAFEPSSAELLLRIDELLVEQGSPGERLSLYRVALERETDAVRRRELLYGIARIKRRDLDDLAGAVVTLRQLATESPDDSFATDALLEALGDAGDHLAVVAELESALKSAPFDRRSTLLEHLARALLKVGQRERALSIHRELIAADALPVTSLAEVAELARGEGDFVTLAAVLERKIARAGGDAEQLSDLERLAEVRTAELGDGAGATDAWRRAARLSRDVHGDGAQTRLLHERWFDSDPTDGEVSRYLVVAHAKAGDWEKVPAPFAVLLRADATQEPLELLLELAASAITAGAVDPFVRMVDEAAFSHSHDGSRRSRELMGVKARALASVPSRRRDASAIFRGIVESFGEASDVEDFRRFLDDHGDDRALFEDLRWLFSYRAGRTADPVAVLLEWAEAEERMGDLVAAAGVFEEVLAVDPSHASARAAISRLALSRGDAEGLLRVLTSLSDKLSPEDRVDTELEMAAFLVEPLGRRGEALSILSRVLERAPHPDAIRTARRTLGDPESVVPAARLLGRIALSMDAGDQAALLQSLLDDTRGNQAVAVERATWLSRLVELLSSEPRRALEVAVQAATEMPGEPSLWDAAERFARRAGDSAPLAEAYARALDSIGDPALFEAVGQRYVDFHEEWFDDSAAVLALLERVLAGSPRARWALDRIKLAYNADARWDELFKLYDRAIEGALTEREREDLLEEAAVAAKDLANDPNRAIFYLERLGQLRDGHDTRVEALLERLYERTGRSRELLELLEKRLGSLKGPELTRLEVRLARLELDLGDVQAAFNLVERVLRAEPGEPSAYALLERLVRMPVSKSAPPSVRPTAPRKSSSPSEKKKNKNKNKNSVPKDVRHDAVRLLESRCRQTEDKAGLARALEAALDLARTVKERTFCLEELVALYETELSESPRAFAHMATLVATHPRSAEYRRRLGELSRLTEEEERRAEILRATAEASPDPSLRIELLRESADVLDASGNHDGAVVVLLRVLDLSLDNAETTLRVGERLEPLLSSMGRPRERCDVIDRLVASEKDPARRRSALVRLATIAFEELHDVSRAIAAWRGILDAHAEDLEALSGLEHALSHAGRYLELADVLLRRAALQGDEGARRDRVRVAEIQAEKIRNLAAAIETWRAIRKDYGPDPESFERLSTLLASSTRWDDLAALYREEASAALEPVRRSELLRALGDLHRDRTGKPIRALEAYVEAGDFARTTSVADRVSDRDVLLGIAEALLDLSVKAWSTADSDLATTIVDAAEWAVETLVRLNLERGAFDKVVQVELSGASLPFPPNLRRKLKRDAAWTTCDRLENIPAAIELLHELFVEDPGDEVALASVTRFARLLDEAGRHAELAELWEAQAKSRAEAGERGSAAALWARAAKIWQTALGDVERAIAVHRLGAAFGGEESLEALARIYADRRDPLLAAECLEWLSAQSTREDIAERSLRLADAYLSLGQWERARVRLEAASRTAIDGSAVRARLSDLYRRHSAWEPLSALLAADADRVTDDRTRLSLLREAAALHTNERGDPAAAVPLLERAVEIEPDEPSLRLTLSEALRASGRFDEAAEVLRAQVERYGHRRPKDRALFHLYLARVALAAGRRAEALSELDVGAKINPAHPGILYELGKLAFEVGQLARAERTYRGLLLVLRKPDEDPSEAPGRAELYLDLSEIAARQNEPARAAELIESAFEAALDDPRDAESLEQALRKSSRDDLLTRAIEARLAAATDPAAQARALSDLVVVHAGRGSPFPDVAARVRGEAARIKRALESRRAAEPLAWASMTTIYQWLGDAGLEAAALEHRVAALVEAGGQPDVDPILRLAEIQLGDRNRRRDDAVLLLERALEFGGDRERVWSLSHAALAETPRNRSLLSLLERIAREPGRERDLARVVALRADAGPIEPESVRQASAIAQKFGDRSTEEAMLRAALAHPENHLDARDEAWIRERLGRLLLEEGARADALDLLERAAELCGPDRRRSLLLDVARLAATALSDTGRAARSYESLLRSDASDREVWEPLLELYRRQGERARLIALIESTAPHVESLRDRSRLRFEEATLILAEPSGIEGAIGVLRDIVDEDPGMQSAADLLGSVLDEHGRYAELADLVRTQIDVAKSSGEALRAEQLHLRLAGLLERTLDLEGALVAYHQALEWNESSRDALRSIVRLAERGGVSPADAADAVERLLAVEEPEEAAKLGARLVELRTAEGDSGGIDRALELACAASPLDVALRERLVARCLAESDWNRAAEVLRRAWEADSSDLGVLAGAVAAYESAADLEPAVALLGVAIEKHPSNADLRMERARLFADLDLYGDALEDLEVAITAGVGKVSDLVKALEAAVERSTGEARTRHTLRLVDLLEGAGEISAARDYLSELLKVEPKHRDALRRLASLASAEARWEQAAATYRRLVALEEGDALVDAAMNLADACEHGGHLADARGGLERALEALPSRPELRDRLIQLYESTGATRELAQLLLREGHRVVDVAARTTALLRAAELLLERDGDADEAISVLTEVRRLSPENIQGAVLLARAHSALGRPRDAMAALDGVVVAHRGRRSKDLALVHREISNIHLESGHLPGALDALAKAFDLDMRNGELAMQLGHLALDVSDTDTAAKAFRSVTMMRLKTPGSPEGASAESKAVAYYHLSRIAHAQGDVRKARLMASKAVSENPNHSEAQLLLKELRAV